MKNNSRLFFLTPLLCLAVFLPGGFASEDGRADAIQVQFDEIKTRLENVEKQQQEIAAKDDKILEELDRLRIWVHRK